MTDTPMPTAGETLMCFPFLAIHESFTVGPWKLVRLTEALQSETWASDQFKANVKAMLGLFRHGLLAAHVKDPTVVSRVDCGITGEPPETSAERKALIATVAFSALDTNREIDETNWASAVVAEHLDYWEFPVSADGFLLVPSGRRVRTWHAANWSERQPVIGPTAISVIPRVRVNPVGASVLYEALSHRSDDAKRLRTAITVLVESWRNHSGVVGLSSRQLEQGVVICDQQTAFEVLLLGTSQGSAKEQIVQKFQELIDQVSAIDPVVGRCSDSLSEHTQDQRREWVASFTRHRNKTIHEGDALAGLSDEANLGKRLLEVVDMADRMLRDAIRVKAALIAELRPGETLQNALASPSNNDYQLRLAVERAWDAVSTAHGGTARSDHG